MWFEFVVGFRVLSSLRGSVKVGFRGKVVSVVVLGFEGGCGLRVMDWVGESISICCSSSNSLDSRDSRTEKGLKVGSC